MSHFRRPRVGVLLASLSGVLLVSCQAEEPSASGPGCPIELKEEVTLSGPEVGNTWTLAATENRIYLRPTFARYQVSIFDRKGNLVSVLGSEGDGPGEYRMIRAIVPLGGDELVILDGRNARMTWTTDGGRVLGSAPLPVFPVDQGAELLPDSSLLVAGRGSTMEDVGQPLFHVSREGEVLSAFGGRSRGDLRERVGARTSQWATATDDGTVWSIERHQLALREWSLEGEPLDSVLLKREWFYQVEGLGGNGRDERQIPVVPETQVVDLDVDPEGQVWVAALIPDPEWEDAVDGRHLDPREGYDTMIEVWDPESRTTVCSIRSDEHMVRFLGEGEIASYRETRRGEPEILIWRLRG